MNNVIFDLMESFKDLYNSEFVNTKLWKDMEKTSEATMWHREPNVAIHTDMVMEEYYKTYPDNWTHTVLLGAFACAFHDVGKPRSEQVKHSEARGEYRSYSGHEQISARLWEDWALTNKSLLKYVYEFSVIDIYKIGWLIQSHLPYKTTKARKVSAFKSTAVKLFCDVELYCSALRADSRGRTSDKWEENQIASDEWYDMLREFKVETLPELATDAPECVIMIGASGSGKSTHVKKYYSDYVQYSWDSIRMRDYLTDDDTNSKLDYVGLYDTAHSRAESDPDFKNNVQKEYTDILKTGNNVVVDNLNISAKRRYWFIHEARQRGYKVTAQIIPVNLNILRRTASERSDRDIKFGHINGMYMGTVLPSYHEFDQVNVSSMWWDTFES